MTTKKKYVRKSVVVPAKLWEKGAERRRRDRAAAEAAKEKPVRYELSVEDLRDDVVSVIANSGLSLDEIQYRFGPAPSTVKAWQEKTVLRPHMSTMRAALRACGRDLVIGDIAAPALRVVA